jgi:hypothetical protein
VKRSLAPGLAPVIRAREWLRDGFDEIRRLRGQLLVGGAAMLAMLLAAELVDSREASRWLNRATTPVVLGLVYGWRRLGSASDEIRTKLAEAAASFAVVASATALVLDFVEHSLPKRPGLLLWVGLLALGLWASAKMGDGEQR